MENFDEILEELKNRKRTMRILYELRTAGWCRVGEVGRPKGNPCVTPLGRFDTISAAARAHGFEPSWISYRIERKVEGFYYEEGVDANRRTQKEAVGEDEGQNPNAGAQSEET